MLTRRALLAGGASLIGSSAFAKYPPEECWATPTPGVMPVGKPEKAASLNRLIDDAMLGGRPRFGMSRIEGFTFENDDTIFWGRQEPNREALKFEDFVIALRSINGVYGKTVAGVSLDSDPELHSELAKLVAANRTPSREAVASLCREHKGWARIHGLPHDAQMT